MFTGIVAAIGQIETVSPLGDSAAGVRLAVNPGTLSLDDVSPGDSIALQGACMTVVTKHHAANGCQHFIVDVSRESLVRTAGLDTPGAVNLEKALHAHDRLGGHLVAGHIDGVGAVTHFAPAGESYELRVLAPHALGRYLAYKGSVTVNGVSLTINKVQDLADGCEFSINLIAHTLSVTTLKQLKVGTRVNLEIDLIARYVERILSFSKTSAP
ncbi:riboflavin synthase [Mycoavidus sp. B2-EB]|uniref:riboflavin synthase n=1 Tax=Mycoavidus sp. B2-EB TaxID=2651972 RepID=UPI0016278AA4|nr:riboflavin synthase [Mycoavidus sp. B2-EB]BBO59041.1 riboflavin synthase subunit alpha [Mycoavidus sp. B2-EB]